MLTIIEKFLFQGRNITHAVVEFTLSPTQILLTLAPWSNLKSTIRVRFSDLTITSLDLLAENPVDFNLPWDIIGFDSDALDSERWDFCLHCSSIEYGFESLWPVVLSDRGSNRSPEDLVIGDG